MKPLLILGGLTILGAALACSSSGSGGGDGGSSGSGSGSGGTDGGGSSSSSSGGSSSGSSGGSSSSGGGSSSGAYSNWCYIAGSECVNGEGNTAQCTNLKGTQVASCPTTGLVGCCTIAQVTTETCYYKGQAANLQSTCTSNGGTWATSP